MIQELILELAVVTAQPWLVCFCCHHQVAAGLGGRPVVEVFTCGSLDPEPCVEHGIGSVAGQGCYLCGGTLLAVLGPHAWYGLELCHVSQGQAAVVRDIQGVGALLSGVGLTESSEDGPRGSCVVPSAFPEGLV